MDIQDMRIFARVAAVQNLSSVGCELGLTPGTISKRLQALERELSARLFDRTTRSVRITEEGAKLLEYVNRILSDLERARAAVGANVEKPRGRLRVSAPALLGRHEITPAICAFMSRYRDIDVHIDLTDRIVNLQEEGYDVAIRAGALPDSGLKAKRLIEDPQIIVASPEYLKVHGEPQHPKELETRCCLVHGDVGEWTFVVDGKPRDFEVKGRLRSDNGGLLRHAAIEGLGFLKVSSLRVAQDIKEDLLRRVLADYAVAPPSAIYAVYPGSQLVLPKLRVFLDFLGVWFTDRRNGARHDGMALANGRSSTAKLLAPRPMPECAVLLEDR